MFYEILQLKKINYLVPSLLLAPPEVGGHDDELEDAGEHEDHANLLEGTVT